MDSSGWSCVARLSAAIRFLRVSVLRSHVQGSPAVSSGDADLYPVYIHCKTTAATCSGCLYEVHIYNEDLGLPKVTSFMVGI